MKNKTKVFIAIIIFILIICVSAFTYAYYQLLPVNNSIDNEYTIQIEKGDRLKPILALLEEDGIIKSSKITYLYARIFNIMLKTGIYSLDSSMNSLQVLDVLQSGVSITISVSIPEGLTIRQIAEILEANNIVQKEDFIKESKNPIILTKYSISASNVEGFLYPDTYNFPKNMSSMAVIELMLDNFFNKTAEIPNFSQKSIEEQYKIIILASIIEREYRVKEEAPLISSVFWNRLNSNINLESCATVVYIITEILGKPHPEKLYYIDLEIKNPYNSYRNQGLPPGPISNPSLVALDAATNPASTDYLFFRVVDESQGRHHFSSTFEEHASVPYMTTKKVNK